MMDAFRKTPLPWRLLLAVGIEILYAISTRSWLGDYATGIELELYVSAVRAITALVYWVLFQDIIAARTSRQVSSKHPSLWLGMGVVCLAPLVSGDWALPDQKTQLVFAATSLVVAVREEILYRGVLQNILEQRLGWWGAIIITNIIFTLYHYGAWPFTPQNVLEFFFVGSLVSVLYWATGSLLLPIVFHAVYDALWCFTPLHASPWAWGWGAGAQILGVVILLAWILSSVTANHNTRPA
ncbi:MAG: membrane protease YdiL (CAAX protease family) [Gammaproteobacteria bacterium]|jgi:membrane protease YdiL (CAAX protease family)